MNCAVEMGSIPMIYIPSFIKTGSGIQQLMGGRYSQTHTDTQTVWRSQKPTLGR
jgi:hypothetical protein